MGFFAAHRKYGAATAVAVLKVSNKEQMWKQTLKWPLPPVADRVSKTDAGPTIGLDQPDLCAGSGEAFNKDRRAVPPCFTFCKDDEDSQHGSSQRYNDLRQQFREQEGSQDGGSGEQADNLGA